MESKEIKNFFDRLVIRELIIKCHGKTGSDTTRGNSPGKAVDGIWVTRGVNIIAGGYLDYHVGVRS